jgi:hypothetical protein
MELALMNTTIVTTTGIHPVETGCWIAGHHGQYGPDRLADIAEGFGWTPDDCLADPRQVRLIVDTIDAWGYTRTADGCPICNDRRVVGIVGSLWETHAESVDIITHWLNDHTEDGYSWGWEDGEFYLWTTAEWEATA